MIEKMNFGASVFANLRRWNQFFLSKVQIKKNSGDLPGRMLNCPRVVKNHCSP